MTVLVSIIEDSALIRRHLVDLINASDRCCIAGSACNGAEARVLIAKNTADVYLVDLGLPDVDGVELIALINSSCPSARTIVFSTFGDIKHIQASISAGASGYLLKDDTNLALIDKIVSVHKGDASISASLVKVLLHKTSVQGENQESSKRFSIYGLSVKELKVMHLLVLGHSIVSIGDNLSISSHTVNQNLRSIYRKLDVHSRAMAVNVAVMNGFLDL